MSGDRSAYTLTSDDKKTERSITLKVASKSRKDAEQVIGGSAQYIVLAVLGKQGLTATKIDALSRVTIEILQKKGLSAKTVGFAGSAPDSQISLF